MFWAKIKINVSSKLNYSTKIGLCTQCARGINSSDFEFSLMTSPDSAKDPKFHWKQNLFGSHKSCPAGIQACNSDSRMQIPEFVRGFLDERPSRTCLDPIKFDDDQTFSKHAKLIQCENDAAQKNLYLTFTVAILKTSLQKIPKIIFTDFFYF